jgi:hypothetical protein
MSYHPTLCPFCGKPKRARSLTCSISCGVRFAWQNKGGAARRVCKNCRKSYPALHRGKGFCSRSCCTKYFWAKGAFDHLRTARPQKVPAPLLDIERLIPFWNQAWPKAIRWAVLHNHFWVLIDLMKFTRPQARKACILTAFVLGLAPSENTARNQFDRKIGRFKSRCPDADFLESVKDLRKTKSGNFKPYKKLVARSARNRQLRQKARLVRESDNLFQSFAIQNPILTIDQTTL